MAPGALCCTAAFRMRLGDSARVWLVCCVSQTEEEIGTMVYPRKFFVSVEKHIAVWKEEEKVRMQRIQ